jgi:hypothetical protein
MSTPKNSDRNADYDQELPPVFKGIQNIQVSLTKMERANGWQHKHNTHAHMHLQERHMCGVSLLTKWDHDGIEVSRWD